ncbi:HI1450 family dsDNA-mimic protein [Pseudoalteromonas fenneropenaei]|uniref:HI1450 family dsDNA-mimic protein n=1 Tax=Pseudoalteromonas fenneropenaei TaxID=1737459 RepID=A0ABV7CGW7_9GAMM
MMSARLYSVEEITDQAYEIFLELAPDNLSEADIELFNEYREEAGFIEDSEADESWAEFVSFEIEPEAFVQVLVGLELDGKDMLFAKILISRDMDAPFCHLVWPRGEA